MKTYRPLPDYLTIQQSNIDGLGLFTNEDIDSNFSIGVSHVMDVRFQDGYIRTPLGGWVNHSETPNCQFVTDNDIIKIETIRKINAGEELTAYYTLYKPKK